MIDHYLPWHYTGASLTSEDVDIIYNRLGRIARNAVTEERMPTDFRGDHNDCVLMNLFTDGSLSAQLWSHNHA